MSGGTVIIESNGQATGGTFSLQCGEFHSAELPFDASEEAVQSEYNRIADLQAESLKLKSLIWKRNRLIRRVLFALVAIMVVVVAFLVSR